MIFWSCKSCFNRLSHFCVLDLALTRPYKQNAVKLIFEIRIIQAQNDTVCYYDPLINELTLSIGKT